MFKLRPRFDLGVRALLPEWKALLSRKDLGSDLAAGLTVACVAVPLSLAIALASGVAPAVGLVTAIIAGIICALFGGTPLQVSGPAAAMAVLVASIVQQQGMGALLLIGIGCGVLQLATGVLGLGRFARLVPLPVIEGFTAGIGAIILIGQLPRALGLPAPEESHVLDVITHIAELLPRSRPAAIAIALTTLAIIYGLPKITRRIPAPLVAVVAATLLASLLRVDAETIGTIPRSLPSPSLPRWGEGLSLGGLAGGMLAVFALASLETLLSATAVDKLSTGRRSDPDQELVGQGLGNIASAIFGGIPVTGVIARSGTNVQAGAKTRRAAIIHALALLATVFLLAPWIERIPIAALAAVLFSVAFRMLSPRSLRRLWKNQRSDGIIYIVTFVAIVFVDLLEGVQWGLVAAFVIAAVRLGRTRLVAQGRRIGESYVFALSGPLTFLSSLDVESLEGELRMLESGRAVVFDLRGVTSVDASGEELLLQLVERARTAGLSPLVVGLSGSALTSFSAAMGKDADAIVADGERSLVEHLGVPLDDADSRLRAGVERYRATTRPRYESLFEKLGSGQSPHTLFITCSDSRIDPGLITSTEPGELFLVRDVGNIVPKGNVPRASAAAAAIDYAVGILGVTKIIVCGHSACGAIKALRADTPPPADLIHLHAWLEATEVHALLRPLPSSLDLDEISKLNTLAQLDNLRTYEVVARRVASGHLSLGAWFFDVARGEIEEWSEAERRFVRVGAGEERINGAEAATHATHH